jgi:ABC-type microcin C transport system permease subunit YejE
VIGGFLETLAEISSENPTLYGLIVVAIILVEGLLLALFLELVFRILGIEVKEIPHH